MRTERERERKKDKTAQSQWAVAIYYESAIILEEVRPPNIADLKG